MIASRLPLLTATCILYHAWQYLSTPFLKFFKKFFRLLIASHLLTFTVPLPSGLVLYQFFSLLSIPFFNVFPFFSSFRRLAQFVAPFSLLLLGVLTMGYENTPTALRRRGTDIFIIHLYHLYLERFINGNGADHRLGVCLHSELCIDIFKYI